VVLAAVLAAAVASAAPPTGSCRVALPQGPAVPAPVVFRTGCGGFWLARDGTLSRLPRGWFAAHASGTGRRFGADLDIRRNRAGRIFVLRKGHLVWRSHGLYPNTGDTVAFGPRAFAFNSYYRGVYRTDLRGPERLVYTGRARYPHSFFPSGRLLVTGGRALVVLSPDGRVERRYGYLRGRGYSFDTRSDTLFFVTPRGRLATLHESRLRVGRRLAINGWLSVAPEGPLLFSGLRSLALATRDGRLLASARWPRSRLSIVDSGFSIAPDGRRVAFRLSDARAGARKGNAALFLLRAGERRARAVYRHRLGPVGCGTGANMSWRDQYLLYGSADGELAIIHGVSGHSRDLSRLAKTLPRRGGADRPIASWASDYGR
jgi:hypothetical protein